MDVRIKKIMREKGITSIFLAEKLGVSTVTVSRMINGRALPSVETLNKVADILGVPFWQLFQDPEEVYGKSFLPSITMSIDGEMYDVKLMPKE